MKFNLKIFRVYPNPSSGIINIESMAMDEETKSYVDGSKKK